jgi:hypothetical protein
MRLRPFAKERDVAPFCCALALAITILLPPPKSDEEKRESRFRDIHAKAIAKAEEYAYLPKVARYAPFQEAASNRPQKAFASKFRQQSPVLTGRSPGRSAPTCGI